MSKRILIITIVLCLIVFGVGIGFAVWHSVSTQPEFASGGYVLQESEMGAQQLSFLAQENYALSANGTIRFQTAGGEQAVISSKSFAFLDNGSVMALSDGILLDFQDLSENFINNYYITAKLPIYRSGDSYTAETTAGMVTFGDHLWKLSDQRYLIQSPTLTVCFSEEDRRQTQDFVQVNVTDDGIVQIFTKENTWMTISENCYIETEGGVRIYPVSQRIENTDYKLSIAKLSVSADDSIVLTEDETRRQVVPQLNIDTIDGKDGENGEEGQAGQAGDAGKDGSAGASGEKGQSGENGAMGEDGAAGAGGSSGESGAGGAGGAGGESGESGQSGEAGAGGASGEGGAQGEDGASGSDGKKGASGKKGNDAVVSGTTNTALPTMTFTRWEVTATSLRGTISVTDENGYLSEAGGSQNRTASVVIYDVETGESIACYEITSPSAPVNPDSDTTSFDGFYTGSEEVYFGTADSALKPDTLYRISVHAYYRVNETDTVYSREFISRTFYTDSTGVYLSPGEANVNSVAVNVAVSEAYRNSVSTVNLFLLTPAQNDTFTAASNSYVYKCVLDYKNNSVYLYKDGGSFAGRWQFEGDFFDETLVFDDLTANTNYIARVQVNTDTLQTLTRQKQELSTLKTPPTWEGEPKANYNRVTGGFEVTRPVVTDRDGGAVCYVYTAYQGDTAVMSRTLTPGQSEPAVFYPESSVDYTFGVTMKFYDNEKEVIYDLGRSTTLRAEGAGLPKVTLEVTDKDYNMLKGNLIINLTDSSVGLLVDGQHPLELAIYADQVYDQTITLTGTEPVTKADAGNRIYTATLNRSDSNYPKVNLDLQNLYKNTNYTITLSGHLNVGDGNDYVYRVIGTVSFMTQDTPALTVSMQSTGDTNSTISMRLKIAAQDASVGTERNAYATSQLENGQVEMQLYSGTGYGASLLASAIIQEDAQLQGVYGDGLVITEALFGNPTLSASSNYTLRVSRVTDQTYEMNMGYENDFEFANNPSATVIALATPPDLLTNPALGVKATPIVNANARTYGAQVDAALPDDAIIGYTLEANYDNSQRLARSVTYYAMEYLEYYNAVNSSTDPIMGNVRKLMQVTLDVGASSDTVPKAAFLFGGTKSEEPSYFGGWNVYYTGEAHSQANSLVEGMGRGFRYVFAYTVEYSKTGGSEADTLGTYPNDHRLFEDYKTVYGIGTTYGTGAQSYGKTLGVGKAYVLNSGMCEAPKVTPDFYTYVYEVKDVALPNANSPSTGKVVIHYTWENDVDETISTLSGNRTQIEYTAQNGQTEQVDFAATPVENSNKWYSVTIPYSAVRGENSVVSPIVRINTYSISGYSNLMEVLRAGTVYEDMDENVYLSRVPVDWAWEKYFKSFENQVLISMDLTHLTDNYIQFNLTENAGSNLRSLLVSRAFALEVKVTLQEDPSVSKTFYLPIETNDLTQSSYAKLSTGMLGMDFLQKRFHVDAEIWYDTGDQGWSIADTVDSTGFLALQFATDVDGMPSLNDYFVVNANKATTTSKSPIGGLLSMPGADGQLVSRLRGLAGNPDQSVAAQFRFWYMAETGASFSRYLRPTHYGIDSSSSATNASGRTVAVKKVAVYDLTFSGSNEGVLTTITPTIEYGGYQAASNFIEVRSFTVQGAAQANQNQVIVGLFDTEADARTFTGAIDTQYLTIDQNGVYDGEGTDIFEGLTPERQYYLAFYMNVNGTRTLLMDSVTADKAIYIVKTSTNVDITSALGLTYEENNVSYFEKKLYMDFSLSRVFGVEVEFDFYRTNEEAEAGTAPPLLSYEDMYANGSGILLPPATLGYNYNGVTINMMPSLDREKLSPGGTYYLRVTAYETVSNVRTEVGSAVFPAKIPAIGYCDALVRTTNVTASSITYQVTVSDPQYSLMGNRTYDNGAGLYAVRFTYTDDNGQEHRLVTKYDQFVYSANVPRHVFVLDPSVLTQTGVEGQEIVSGRQYSLHVYAVIDETHTGQSRPINDTGEKQNWEYFFGNLQDGQLGTETYPIASAFSELLDSFWTVAGDFANNPAMDNVEQNFHITEKKQLTSSEGGVLLNKSAAVITRSSQNRLRLLLPESFGIISDTGEQAYKKIEWDIKGSTTDGTAVRFNGTSRASLGDELFKTSSGDSYKFYYDIPRDISRGSYMIVIQLYPTEDGPDHETLSFTFYEE